MAGNRLRIPLLAAVLSGGLLAASCERAQACSLPAREPLRAGPPQIDRPDLDAALRECLAANRIVASARQLQAPAAGGFWDRYVRGDDGALSNDAKIGALLLLEGRACLGCTGAGIAAALAGLYASGKALPEDVVYLSALQVALPETP